jgi:hypothetical protein
VSEDKPTKKSKKQAESENDYDDEEQNEINDYGDSSADEVSEDEKTMRKRLVQESDDEGDLQADQGNSSDEMSDI